MLVNFKKLGAALAEAGLTGKPVDRYSKEEVETLVSACIEALVPPKEGPFKTPYIDEHNELIIPFDADPKFHWWRPCGQSMAVTLREMKVPDEVWAKYAETNFDLPF
jgi:hypothetical protein